MNQNATKLQFLKRLISTLFSLETLAVIFQRIDSQNPIASPEYIALCVRAAATIVLALLLCYSGKPIAKPLAVLSGAILAAYLTALYYPWYWALLAAAFGTLILSFFIRLVVYLLCCFCGIFIGKSATDTIVRWCVLSVEFRSVIYLIFPPLFACLIVMIAIVSKDAALVACTSAIGANLLGDLVSPIYHLIKADFEPARSIYLELVRLLLMLIFAPTGAIAQWKQVLRERRKKKPVARAGKL